MTAMGIQTKIAWGWDGAGGFSGKGDWIRDVGEGAQRRGWEEQTGRRRCMYDSAVLEISSGHALQKHVAWGQGSSWGTLTVQRLSSSVFLST